MFALFFKKGAGDSKTGVKEKKKGFKMSSKKIKNVG
jgi:hypothetical protein